MTIIYPHSLPGLPRKPPRTILDLTGAIASYYDTNTASSLTLNSQASVQTVSQWNDLSGMGRHFTQSTPASQPRFVQGNGNLLSYSQDVTASYWQKTGTTLANGAIVAPDGANTGTQLTAALTGSCFIQFQNPINVTPNTVYTASAYIKKSNATWVNMQFYNGTEGFRYWFNLDTGVVGGVAPIGTPATWVNFQHTMTDVGGGWFRCTITANVGTSTTLTIANVAHFATIANNSFQSTTGQSTFVWGSMLNEGMTANDYIGINLLEFNGSQSLNSSFYTMGTLTAIFSRTATTQSVVRASAQTNFRGFAGNGFPGFTVFSQYAANNFSLSATNPALLLPVPPGGRNTLSLLYGGGTFQPSLANTAFTLGFDTPGQAPLNGFVGTLLATNRALTLTEAQKLQVYLARRYGNWRSLASGNPFRYYDVSLVY